MGSQLNHGSRNSAEQEHRADEELRVQNKSLQESVDQLRTELASLYGKLKAQEKDLNNAQRSSSEFLIVFGVIRVIYLTLFGIRIDCRGDQ